MSQSKCDSLEAALREWIFAGLCGDGEVNAHPAWLTFEKSFFLISSHRKATLLRKLGEARKDSDLPVQKVPVPHAVLDAFRIGAQFREFSAIDLPLDTVLEQIVCLAVRHGMAMMDLASPEP